MARPPSLHSPAFDSFLKLITQAESSHGWSSLPPNTFFIRGPRYLDTKAKVLTGEPLLQPIAFDLLRSSSKISNVMNHPHCRIRAALTAAENSASIGVEVNKDDKHKPFVWVFNFQLPGKEHLSIVMYYLSFHKPAQGTLMQRFLDGTDAFRNERLKLLSNVPHGPQLMKLTVGEKGSACMVGKVFNCTYKKGKDYVEVDMDVGSSMLASAAYRLCRKVISHATLDLAFVVEGKDRSELPEQVLAGIRLEKLDFSRAVPFNKHIGECEEKDKHTVS